jgi:phosphoribosylanthranilate isomerase
MSRTLVKICGITREEDALLAAGAGADAVGFVFYAKSPRRIEVARAREVARVLPPFVLRIGVFVDASQSEMARAADAVGLDVLQLHGDESPEILADLPRRAIKAVRVGRGFQTADAVRWGEAAGGVVVDTRLVGETVAPGGTGVPFDWALVNGLRDRVPFLMLAGGLSPENVAAAIGKVSPHAVDVSSAVERLPGQKDPDKVRAFVRAVREVDASSSRTQKGDGGR